MMIRRSNLVSFVGAGNQIEIELVLARLYIGFQT